MGRNSISKWAAAFSVGVTRQFRCRLACPGRVRAATGVTPVVPEDVFEAGDELVGIGEQLRQRLVDYIFQAEREQVFRGRVGIDDPQFIVHQDDRGCEQI